MTSSAIFVVTVLTSILKYSEHKNYVNTCREKAHISRVVDKQTTYTYRKPYIFKIKLIIDLYTISKKYHHFICAFSRFRCVNCAHICMNST